MPLRIPCFFTALTLTLAACTPPEPAAEASADQNEMAEVAAAVHSRGTVVAVTPEYSAITIQHEPIPEYGMDAMTMEFTVADASQLEGIVAGDRVSFELSGPIDIRAVTKDER